MVFLAVSIRTENHKNKQTSLGPPKWADNVWREPGQGFSEAGSQSTGHTKFWICMTKNQPCCVARLQTSMPPGYRPASIAEQSFQACSAGWNAQHHCSQASQRWFGFETKQPLKMIFAPWKSFLAPFLPWLWFRNKKPLKMIFAPWKSFWYPFYHGFGFETQKSPWQFRGVGWGRVFVGTNQWTNVWLQMDFGTQHIFLQKFVQDSLQSNSANFHSIFFCDLCLNHYAVFNLFCYVCLPLRTKIFL